MLDVKVIDSLRKYKGISALRKEAMSVLVKMLNQKEIGKLRAIFEEIDEDQTGMINIHELEQALH